ncbi:hypothetical protein ABIB85_004469 [Bradyrhizobium sp. JR1.5]|uniref:hypothetical protein n=1 Tax=unclassified Bradyrhizobium TaxID=2631580 RepID=UPI0033924F8D
MPAFLVRLIKNKDFVGIFTADDEIDLELAVDECTDVPYCEYPELPDGGIMWESPAKPVPLDRGDPEDDEAPVEEFLWGGASLSERWWSIAYGFEEVEWIPFVEGGPAPESDPQVDPAVRRPMGPARIIPIKGRKRS